VNWAGDGVGTRFVPGAGTCTKTVRTGGLFKHLPARAEHIVHMIFKKDALLLWFILVVSALLRMYSINRGGWGFFVDEQRFLDAINIVNSSIGSQETLKNLFTYGIEHKLFLFISALYIKIYNISQDVSFNPVYFFGLFSVLNIYLVYRISLNFGSEKNEALISALIFACSSANFYWSRHLVPYDIALFLGLCSILLATSNSLSRCKAFFCGLIASCCFFTYYGSWIISSIGPLLFFYFSWKRQSLGLIATSACLASSFLLPFVIMWGGVAYYTNNVHYNMISDFIYFSKSINQGEYADGYFIPLQYFFASDGPLSVFWLFSMSSTIYYISTRIKGNKSQRATIYLVILLYIYSLLAIFSTILHKQVAYGRTARQLLPFICLISGFTINHYFIKNKTPRLVLSITLVGISLFESGCFIRLSFPDNGNSLYSIEKIWTKRQNIYCQERKRIDISVQRNTLL